MEVKEKKAFLETMIFVASMDGNFDESERSFFFGTGVELGLSYEETKSVLSEMETNKKTLDEILSGIESDEAKELLLHSLIELCYADGEYSGAERNGMKIICNILNVDESVLKGIEKDWQKIGAKNSLRRGFGAVKNGLAFAGRVGKAGTKIVASGISYGLGVAESKLYSAMESAKQLRKENQELRDELQKTTISEAAKQNIILKLNSKVNALMAELKAEKERNDQNEEIIRLLQAQLEDLEATIEVAEAAKTA